MGMGRTKNGSEPTRMARDRKLSTKGLVLRKFGYDVAGSSNTVEQNIEGNAAVAGRTTREMLVVGCRYEMKRTRRSPQSDPDHSGTEKVRSLYRVSNTHAILGPRGCGKRGRHMSKSAPPEKLAKSNEIYSTSATHRAPLLGSGSYGGCRVVGFFPASFARYE